LALHVAPELLGHLGGADRSGTEQRLQAVRAASEADGVASERGLLARLLRHGFPPFLPNCERLRSNDYHARGARQRKTTISGAQRAPVAGAAALPYGRSPWSPEMGGVDRERIRGKERAGHWMWAGSRDRPRTGRRVRPRGGGCRRDRYRGRRDAERERG